MGWIKVQNPSEPIWWNSETGEMVVMYGPPNPRDSPSVWQSDTTSADAPGNEIQDNLFVILCIDWTEREGEPSRVIKTAFSEPNARAELEKLGIPI